jgi:uncharacterized protein
MRDAGNFGAPYDLTKMMAAIAASGKSDEAFLLFGGEPLLLPKDVLETLWAFGLERSGKNSLQTNGTLIDQDHIALFKRYKVGVGISMDGPGSLNDARWNKSLEMTRSSTARSEAAIARLCSEGMPPSLIVTLHRLNATGSTLDCLIEWFRSLDQMGIKRIGLHLMEVESDEIRLKYQMSAPESVEAIMRLRSVRRELHGVTFTLLEDVEELLLGRDARAKCIWKACDPYTTPAVRGVGGQGEQTKCSRVNKDGVDFLPSTQNGFERYMTLYNTSHSAGGCNGCRFFLMCRGQCPGTAIDGDWRNRSDQCDVWTKIFSAVESELVLEGEKPLSLSPERAHVEKALLQVWESGRNASVQAIVERLRLDRSAEISEMDGCRNEVSTVPNESDLLPKGSADLKRYKLNEFSRLAWASDEARKTWEGRIGPLAYSIRDREWRSVVLGIRSAALLLASSADAPHLISEWKSVGLSWMLLPDEKASTRRYLNDALILDQGHASHYVVAYSQNLERFHQAWEAQSHDDIGKLLGYPVCCQAFANDWATNSQSTDPIWDMAANSRSRESESRTFDINGETATNLLLRQIGLRPVPHWPCSPTCKQTVEFFQQLQAVLRPVTVSRAADHLTEMLSWPMEWSALHGIFEVRTPILKLCGATVFTSKLHSLKWTGRVYPKEGVRGLGFPYRKSGPPDGLIVLN